jgi:hypothetical protein
LREERKNYACLKIKFPRKYLSLRKIK